MTEKPKDVTLEYAIFTESDGKLITQMWTESVTEWKKSPAFDDNFVIGNLIRTTNSAGFRNGQWGEIVEKISILRPDNSFRKCIKVVFPDDASDIWPMDDPAAGYEFSSVL